MGSHFTRLVPSLMALFCSAAFAQSSQEQLTAIDAECARATRDAANSSNVDAVQVRDHVCEEAARLRRIAVSQQPRPPASAEAPTSPGPGQSPPPAPNDNEAIFENPQAQLVALRHCRQALSGAENACALRDLPTNSTPGASGGLGATHERFQTAAQQSYEALIREAATCINKAQDCKATCDQSLHHLQGCPTCPATGQTSGARHSCGQLQDKARTKMKQAEQLLAAIRNSQGAQGQTRTTPQPGGSEDRVAETPPVDPTTGAPASPSQTLPSAGGSISLPTLPQSTPQPQSTRPQQTAQSDPQNPTQTAEDRERQARREQRARRLNELFKSVGPTDEAQLERPLGTVNQSSGPNAQQIAAAMAAIAKANAMAAAKAGSNGKLDDNSKEAAAKAGAAHFANLRESPQRRAANPRATAEQPVPGALATAPIASAGLQTQVASSPTVGSFSSAGAYGSAALDARPSGERPSDLPNLKFSSPDAASGNGSSSARASASDINLADYLPNGSRYNARRGPAGVDEPERAEVAPRTLDIWELVSNRFKRHCAQDRLVDCARHLKPE